MISLLLALPAPERTRVPSRRLVTPVYVFAPEKVRTPNPVLSSWLPVAPPTIGLTKLRVPAAATSNTAPVFVVLLASTVVVAPETMNFPTDDTFTPLMVEFPARSTAPASTVIPRLMTAEPVTRKVPAPCLSTDR